MISQTDDCNDQVVYLLCVGIKALFVLIRVRLRTQGTRNTFSINEESVSQSVSLDEK